MQMHRRLVSIVVAVYNVADYINACIDSLRAQSYRDIEILLIDDGSTDGSASICDQAAASDNRIKVFHKHNGGLSDARNAGLQIMTGDYVVFVDGDDVVSSRYIEALLESLVETNADISICTLLEISSQQNKAGLENVPKTECRVCSGLEAAETMLRGVDFGVTACGKLFKKDLWSNYRFPFGRVYEDLSAIPTVVSQAESVAFIDLPLYGQVMRSGSITRSSTMSIKQYFDYYDAIETNRAQFESHENDSVRKAFRIRELVECARLLRVASSVEGDEEAKQSIYNYAKKRVSAGLSEGLLQDCTKKERIAVMTSYKCPALNKALFGLYQQYKSIKSAMS